MAYTYVGSQVLTYPDFVDEATGRMLVADPAHEDPYEFYHVNTGSSDPPNDGRWVDAAPLPPPPPAADLAPAPDPAPKPAPAPEGGVS